MSESFAASNVELEAIDLLLRAERAHLELAEKIRVHREGLESFFNAHHRQSDLVSDCDEREYRM